ncbi:hypothetical protein N7451_011161 [Penicillium sp. IBT 35674x]|nr:hypothetical protein N7451_011161 [Penicillium sp. IBT 35674x]
MADSTSGGVAPIPITVEFTGGLEILFSNERKHKITVPGLLDDGSQPNISYLLRYLVDNLMKDQRKELFIMEDNVYVTLTFFLSNSHQSETNIWDSRPGILVLINDADWELEGEEAYELQPGDNIVFVSTLHGG